MRRRKPQSKYFIEIRYFGQAKKQIKNLILDVDNKFNLPRWKKVPHITVIQPFKTKNQRRLVSDFKNICSSYDKITFKVKGFGVFPFFVVYAKVKPSKELIKIRKELINTLKKYCKITDFHRRYKPHTTIALRMGFFKFFRIWFHLLKKPKPNINNHALRITLLKDSKIIYEYDLFDRKLLNRKQALSKKQLGRTFKQLKKS